MQSSLLWNLGKLLEITDVPLLRKFSLRFTSLTSGKTDGLVETTTLDWLTDWLTLLFACPCVCEQALLNVVVAARRGCGDGGETELPFQPLRRLNRARTRIRGRPIEQWAISKGGSIHGVKWSVLCFPTPTTPDWELLPLTAAVPYEADYRWCFVFSFNFNA
jgi:hypothetical protein